MTVKQLFPQLSDKHRLWLGRSIASSYKTINAGVPASQVLEDGIRVNDYPEHFRKKINQIFRRFCKKVDVSPRKKKRSRIKRQLPKRFEKVEPKRKPNG